MSGGEPFVDDLATLGQADGGGDFIVFGKDGFARFLVPEGGEEIVEVAREQRRGVGGKPARHVLVAHDPDAVLLDRSEEHTSELQSLLRISYAVFCLKKKKIN